MNTHATPAENERFRAFLDRLEAEGFSPVTRACYASDWYTLSEFAHGRFGRRFRIDRFPTEDFERQRRERVESGVAPATMNRRLAFLRRYAAFAADREPALRAVADAYAQVPFLPVPRRAGRALTPGQEERLRAAAEALGAAEAAIVALLLATGMRASEAAALVRSDVAGPPHAPSAVHVRGPRSKTFFLPPPCARALAAVLAADALGPSQPLFRRGDGRALGEPGIAAAVARAAREAGVPATPRTLRHTFAMRYLGEHRGDVEGLARALGQQSRAAARAYRDESARGEPGVRVLRWDDLPEEQGDGATPRRVLVGERLEAVRAVHRPGATGHQGPHVAERMTFVLSGRVTVRFGAERRTAGAGDVVCVPPGVAHAIEADGARPAVTLSVFTPPRRRTEPTVPPPA